MKKILQKLLDFIIQFISSMWLWDPNEIAGEHWRIHKIDPDQNFPSVPHLDCISNSKKKMNIYTGEIFIKRKCVDKATKKELKKLWSHKYFRDIVYDERIRYKDKLKKEYEENVPEEYIEEYNEFLSKFEF